VVARWAGPVNLGGGGAGPRDVRSPQRGRAGPPARPGGISARSCSAWSTGR